MQGNRVYWSWPCYPTTSIWQLGRSSQKCTQEHPERIANLNYDDEILFQMTKNSRDSCALKLRLWARTLKRVRFSNSDQIILVALVALKG